jgi:hypothetical protein
MRLIGNALETWKRNVIEWCRAGRRSQHQSASCTADTSSQRFSWSWEGIEAIIAYVQFRVPSMPREVLEGQVRSERLSIALEVELENKLIPFGVALLDKYPQLQEQHDQRMREEGLCWAL